MEFVHPAGEKPYGRKGSGHAGTPASKDRQQEQDKAGITGFRQQQAMKLLGQWKAHGLTSSELESRVEAGHGAVSAALSALHKAGHVVRLTERRNRQEVYVLPQFVNGRELSPHRPRFNPNNVTDATVEMMQDAVQAAWVGAMDNGQEHRSAAELAVEAVLTTIREITP